MVLLAADGGRDIDIARELEVDRRTVARWRRRFLTARLRGLDDLPGTLLRGRLPEERLQAIVRATVGRAPPHGTVWSTRSLAREFGVSHMTVRRVWELYRVRPPGHSASPPRADPVSPHAPWDVVALYLRPPIAAMVVTLRPRFGEPTRARESTAPPLPIGPLEATPEGVERRIRTAFRSLRAFPEDRERGDAALDDFLRFLGELDRRLVGRPLVRVIARLPDGGISTNLDRWRVRHPDLDMELHADLLRWQRRAVETLREAGRREASLKEFRGPAEIARSLAQSVASYREGRAPLLWMASRGEIASGDSAYRLRYDLAVTGPSGFKSATGLSSPVTGADLGVEGISRKMARVVLRRYLDVRRGERLTVESWSGTLGYANAFVLEALRLGARPLTLLQDEPTYWAASTEVPAKYLSALGEHRKAALEQTDVFVSFFGPSDRERFHALPPATMFKLGEYQDALYRAAERAGARAVQMAIGRVSDASARMYGVDPIVWRRELLEGTLIEPAVLRRRANRVAETLARGRELELIHPNGTRLALRLKGYAPNISDGSVRRASRGGQWSLVTLPAGVISVAVDESAADGMFRSNRASSIGLSDTVGEMDGGRWSFRDGRLTSFAYDVGQEFFAQSYGRAPAGRDRPASISIGLNEHLHSAPLLEDQGLGTVTMHLGRNDYLGGRTRTPWWAWLFLDGADVRVDGRYVVRKGKLSA
jgi:leucyl aminopeptidase (aminopeptidase T)